MQSRQASFGGACGRRSKHTSTGRCGIDLRSSRRLRSGPWMTSTHLSRQKLIETRFCSRTKYEQQRTIEQVIHRPRRGLQSERSAAQDRRKRNREHAVTAIGSMKTGVDGMPQSDPIAIDAVGVARLFSVSLRTVRRWDSAGRLPRGHCIGKRKLWRLADLREWAASGFPNRREIRGARQ